MISDDAGEDFKFLRLLKPSALEPLNANHYPDLYRVAIEHARKTGDLNTAFVLSDNKKTKSSKTQLTRLNKREIPMSTCSESTKKDLEELGLDRDTITRLTQQLAKQQRKHRRRDTTSDSDED